MSSLCYNIYKFSRKVFKVRNLKMSLAEYSLRGLIAWRWRVMTKWLKTPESVVSRDHLFSRNVGLFPEACGYRTNGVPRLSAELV